MSGSVSFTAVLASLAVVISMATYIANKRRSNETQAPSHTILRGDRVPLRPPGSTVSSSAAVHRLSYYAVRAERHVSQHSASTVEWRDDVLGVRMIFSPILFAVEREERQAPLVLVALRYLRQPEHSVSITFEDCTVAVTALEYRDSSLERVRDCAKVIATGTTRIGSVQCPIAEYCYMDNEDRLRYALSVFLTHDYLAVTAQYVADTRVKGVLPTAFNELVRSIEFSQPHETPSYLLCAEPRLGIGLRLPLDFAMEDSLREAFLEPCIDADDAAQLRPSAEAASGSASGVGYVRNSHPGPGAFGRGGNGAWAGVPFAVAVGRGARRMALVASYELPDRSWPAQVERLLRVTLARVGAEPTHEEEEEQGRRQKPVMRPYQRVIPATGDAAADETDAVHAVNVDGTFCVRPVRLSATGLWAAFLRGDDYDYAKSDSHKSRKSRHSPAAGGMEAEGALAVGAGGGSTAEAAGNLESREDGAGAKARILSQSNPNAVALLSPSPSPPLGSRLTADVAAHLCLFCLRVGDDDYVSFVFLASATHHTLEEFITFCHRTLDSLSVGNHFGQSASLTYCNVRHEVLPFHISLGPACTVNETAIGDPVAFFCVAGVTVVLRIFPCAGGVKLERAVQHYLMLLPDYVRVQSWDAAAVVGARAALELEYMCEYEASGNGSYNDDDVSALDEEVGHINPFAQCGTQMHEEPESVMRSPSADSREAGEDAALRVGLIVCGEGCAFLFLAAVGSATIWEARAAVRSLAAGLTIASA